MRPSLLAALLVALVLVSGSAGDTVHLKNGAHLRGKVVEELPDAVVLEMSSGKITIKRRNIERIARDGAEKPRPAESPAPASSPAEEEHAPEPLDVDAILRDLDGDVPKAQAEAMRTLGRSSKAVPRPEDRRRIATVLVEHLVTSRGKHLPGTAEALRAFVDQADVRRLVAATRNAAAVIRRDAAIALGARPEPEVTARLLVLLEVSSDWRVRKAAARSLHGRADARSGLIRLIQEDPDRHLRRLAFKTLAATPWDDALEAAILAGLTSDDAEIRSAAIGALGERRSVKAIPGLAAVVAGDPEVRLRSFAAKMLIRIGDPSAIPLLEAALEEPGAPESDIRMALKALRLREK